MKNIFCIEGAAFAGKTTLLSYLAEKHGDILAIIPEASEYVGGDQHFPSVPFPTLEDAKASTHFFIEVERQRCLEVAKLQKETNLPILLDRSTPLSTVLFFSLLEKKFAKLHTFQNSFYLYAIELFQKELDRGTFFIPENIIYLKPKDETTFLQRLPRGGKNSMFARWTSALYLDREYSTVLKHHYPQKNSLELTTENSAKNLTLISNSVLRFLETAKPKNDTSHFFSNFQGEARPTVYNPEPKIEEKTYQKSRMAAYKLIERRKNAGS